MLMYNYTETISPFDYSAYSIADVLCVLCMQAQDVFDGIQLNKYEMYCILWTRKGVNATVVRAGQCTHAGQPLQLLRRLPPADSYVGTGA